MDEMRYNKSDEKKLIKRYYEKAIQSFNRGRISKTVYEGTTGLLGSPEERQRGMRRINSASVKPRAEASRENLVVRNTYGERIKEKGKVASYSDKERGAGRFILRGIEKGRGRKKEK